jgi:hypothetical protein
MQSNPIEALDAETRQTLRSLHVTLDTYHVCARWTPDLTVEDRCRVCGQSAWMHTARYLLSVIDALEAPVSGAIPRKLLTHKDFQTIFKKRSQFSDGT